MSAKPTTATETVYVYLLDEGVHVWRPVPAEPLGEDKFRLSPEPVPKEETWEFAPGEVVVARPRELSEGVRLVAVGDAERRADARIPARSARAAARK